MIIPKSMPKIKRFFGGVCSHPFVLAHISRLLAAFVDHHGRMSAVQAAGAVASLSRHPAAIGRFLARYGRCLRAMRHRLSDRLREAADHAAGKYVFILDATDVTQQGVQTDNTFSTGNRQRRPAKGRRYNKRRSARRSCHRHVMGLLLTPSGTRIPYYLPYRTRNYCQAQGLAYRTQADLGAALIQQLRVPAGARVVVVADTAYESHQARSACEARGFAWIMPANPERVLAADKPRPKLWSLIKHLPGARYVEIKLSTPQAQLAPQRRLSRCRRGLKEYTPTFYVHQESRRIHSVGEVRIVFSTKTKPHRDRPMPRDQVKILLTNDLQLSAEEIVALYALRWQIELFFKELKSFLGLHQYRFRRFGRAEAWVEACLIAFIYLEWIRCDRLRRAPTRIAREHWRRQRTYGLANAVRQHIVEAELIEIHRCTRTEYGRRKLRKLLRAALPPNYELSA
jgi:Transposase DDE domain